MNSCTDSAVWSIMEQAAIHCSYFRLSTADTYQPVAKVGSFTNPKYSWSLPHQIGKERISATTHTSASWCSRTKRILNMSHLPTCYLLKQHKKHYHCPIRLETKIHVWRVTQVARCYTVFPFLYSYSTKYCYHPSQSYTVQLTRAKKAVWTRILLPSFILQHLFSPAMDWQKSSCEARHADFCLFRNRIPEFFRWQVKTKWKERV